MEMYTVEEISEMLKIPALSIRKYLRDGILQGHRIGKHWRIPKESLEKFLQDTSNKQ
jgi:excisionase family DNA binding protein